MKLIFATIALTLIWMTSTAVLDAQEGYQKQLKLHYDFDQRDGQKVLNTLGAHHPSIPNQASIIDELSVKNGKSGKSLNLRQDNDKTGYVETADHEDFKSQTFSIAAWIKLQQSKKNGSIVCKHDWHEGNARGFVLRCYNGKNLNFTVGAGGWRAAEGKTTLRPHRWIHVAGTFDGTKLTVYINGQPDGTNEVTAPYSPSSYPMRIGHAAFSLDKHRKFNGKIDDVMFWNRTLSARDVLAVYEDQKALKPGPLVAEDIADLMKQLGSKRFKARVDAQKQLISIGSEVLPALEGYLQTEDLEIVVRIEQIKRAIQKHLRD